MQGYEGEKGRMLLQPMAFVFHFSLFIFDLRSSLLTLGKANASIALLSLNRRLHFALRAGSLSVKVTF